MRVVVQNLQKRPSLATDLVRLRVHPDVFLAQEINLPTESMDADFSSAHFTSRMGYGSAIYARRHDHDKGGGVQYSLTNVRKVLSPRAELGGIVKKKTTVATLLVRSPEVNEHDAARGIELVSFHGYNGQPFKSVQGLVEHVSAVLSVLDRTLPALFAGDFNTWTEEHLAAVSKQLEGDGFRRVFSWPYPKRDVPLDHAFVRGLRLVKAESYVCASDHRGAVLVLELETKETETETGTTVSNEHGAS